MELLILVGILVFIVILFFMFPPQESVSERKVRYMTEITMDLTDRDIENINHLKDVWQEEEIDCVRGALNLVADLTKLLDKGDEVFVKRKEDGSVLNMDISGVI